MAAALTFVFERRRSPRLGPDRTPWGAMALLRPGQDVLVLNIGGGGALLESGGRMAPGARTELQLLGPVRHSLRARIVRCHVVALEPVRYRGAIEFEQWLDLDGCHGP